MSPTPIPARLAHRPTQGGLIVPWISVELADGKFDLGNMHNTRVNQCFLERWCQICGEPLDRLMVLFLPDSRLEDMTTSEAPLHPECAAYSRRACPMVAGEMRHYRKSPTRTEGHAGKQCATPGCDCGGWIPTPGGHDNTGRPAERWHAVWCTDFQVTVPDQEALELVNRGIVPVGKPLGARITVPLKIRAVTP